LKSWNVFDPDIINAPVPAPVSHRLLYVFPPPANVFGDEDAFVSLIVDEPEITVPLPLHTVPVPVSVKVPEPIVTVPAFVNDATEWFRLLNTTVPFVFVRAPVFVIASCNVQVPPIPLNVIADAKATPPLVIVWLVVELNVIAPVYELVIPEASVKLPPIVFAPLPLHVIPDAPVNEPVMVKE
jgi:hypothetical protein